mgnify:CR=1 FL=1
MTDGNEPAQHCELAEHVDLLSALEAAAIDHLEVDEHRAIVIYQRAILMIVVTDSLVTSAQAFDVELWNPPTHDPNRDPDDLLTSFIEELVMTTDTTHVDS